MSAVFHLERREKGVCQKRIKLEILRFSVKYIRISLLKIYFLEERKGRL